MVKKTYKRSKTKKRSNRSKPKKIYKEFGPGLRYLIFDGYKHVFRFVG